MKTTAKAFAPGAISSFFEICNQTPEGTEITDPERLGARGGGFGLQKGTTTKVTATPAENSNISVSINGNFVPQAQTTLAVAQMLLANTSCTYDILVEHTVEVPIGAGFGTSAAGALTTALALKEALDLPLTFNQLGKLAHLAEIKCQTGLGTVSSLSQSGGCVLVVEPGAPGICMLDRIPLTPKYHIITGVFKATSKKDILNSPEKRALINRFGKKTLENILAEPSLQNFLNCCWQFAQDAGFATERVRQLIKLAEGAGAVGAAQNMLGEAVHAVVDEANIGDVAEAFKQVLPKENVLISEIDFQGARLVSGYEEI
jgi:pantoate kinase